MRKIQFGAGGLTIDGWENHDMDVDIRLPLPYGDESVDMIFADMVLEHVTHKEAWSFIDECHRVLKPDGALRLVIPDFVRVWRGRNETWRKVNTGVTNCDGTWKDNMKSIIFCHGHQALWSSEVLAAVMQSIGFNNVRIFEMGDSTIPDLFNIEQHWRSVGKEVAAAESGCVQGVK